MAQQLRRSEESWIKNAETRAGPVPRSLHALVDVAQSLTVLELGPDVPSQYYHLSQVQRLLATISNIEVLKISLKAEEPLLQNGTAQLSVNPRRYPNLYTLVLQGVAIAGVDGNLSTLRHLELYDWPSVEPLQIFPFMSLLNTAQNLRTLRLCRYLTNTYWDQARVNRVLEYGIYGQSVPLMEKFYLPRLEKLMLRDVPKVTATFLAWMDPAPKYIEVIGLFGDEILANRKHELLSCMLLTPSTEWSDIQSQPLTHAVLSVGDEMSITFGGEDGARLYIQIESDELNQPQADQKTLTEQVMYSLGWFLGTATSMTSLTIVNLGAQVDCGTWSWMLRSPPSLNQLILHQNPLIDVDCVANLFRLDLTEALIEKVGKLEYIEVHGTPYTPRLLQRIESSVNKRAQCNIRLKKLTLRLRDYKNSHERNRERTVSSSTSWLNDQPYWRGILCQHVDEVQSSHIR